MFESSNKDNEEQSRVDAELSKEEIRKKLDDPSYLPKYDEVLKALPNLRSFSDYTFNKEYPIFEILTREHLTLLAQYIDSRVAELKDLHPGSPVTVLEVGAGNGRLTHFLRQLSGVGEEDARFVASDDNSWSNFNGMKVRPIFEVEPLDYQKAIEIHQPDIVISCWMPHRIDWSVFIRKQQCVQECILIGADSSGTDDTWDTEMWEKDGFTELPYPKKMVNFQISRGDTVDDGKKIWGHSQTAIFVRDRKSS